MKREMEKMKNDIEKLRINVDQNKNRVSIRSVSENKDNSQTK